MVKTITSFSTLMQYARLEAEAIKGGDAEKIRKAKTEHEKYRQICLESDEMIITRR